MPSGELGLSRTAVRNLSIDGMMVDTTQPLGRLSIGGSFRFQFHVPNESDPIKGGAEIVWRQTLDDGIRYGVRFHELAPPAQKLVAQHCGFYFGEDDPRLDETQQ